MPGARPRSSAREEEADREAVQGRVVVVQGDADLLEVVGALGPAGRLAGRLDGRQQQGDQHADDGDDHQQLDQGEATAGQDASGEAPWKGGTQYGPTGTADRWPSIPRGREDFVPDHSGPWTHGTRGVPRASARPGAGGRGGASGPRRPIGAGWEGFGVQPGGRDRRNRPAATGSRRARGECRAALPEGPEGVDGGRPGCRRKGPHSGRGRRPGTSRRGVDMGRLGLVRPSCSSCGQQQDGPGRPSRTRTDAPRRRTNETVRPRPGRSR